MLSLSLSFSLYIPSSFSLSLCLLSLYGIMHAYISPTVMGCLVNWKVTGTHTPAGKQTATG